MVGTMSNSQVRTAIILVIAAVIAIMWVTVQGTAALVVSIVGGIAMAIMGVLARPTSEADHPHT